MINDIRLSVLRKTKPSKEEEQRVEEFVKRLVEKATGITGLECVVCGSIGKHTWLKGDHDIDLFILFPTFASREELEQKGLESGKKITKQLEGRHVIKYAEHPYVHADINGFEVDIVPCYKIKKGEKIKSAVDRSPLHLDYVLENLNAGLRDDVRLLKQFCKGISVYGSDARHLGFSGYICELLVMNYGRFEDVLKAASKWQAPQIIDSRNKEKTDARMFRDQPLIIIDPTDEKRNAAANVNAENFIKFAANAGRFLQKPSGEYFFPQKAKPLAASEIKMLKGRETKFIALQLKKPDVIDDVLYPQLRRAVNRIEGLLRHNEFMAVRSYEHVSDDVILSFEMETWTMPKIKKMFGPPVFSRKHSSEFLAKYKNGIVCIEGNTWTAEKEREFRSASQLLKDFIRKTAGELEKQGIPRNIAVQMGKAKILEHDEFWNYVKSNSDFSAFLKKKFFERIV